MKYRSKILGLLLSAALVTTTNAWAETDHATGSSTELSAGRTSSQPNEHGAGCHAHGGSGLPNSPSRSQRPSPLSYQCCVAGHDAGLVQTPDSRQPLAQSGRVVVQIDAALTSCSSSGLVVSIILFADPPGVTPLRI
jgi:hypothetical protein